MLTTFDLIIGWKRFNPLASNVQYTNIVRNIFVYVSTKHTRKFGSITECIFYEKNFWIELFYSNQAHPTVQLTK